MRWSVFSSSRVRRGAEAFHIARCDVNTDVQIADVACDQGLVVDFATAQDAIHVVADQVHHPVAHAHIELDIRVACVKAGSAGTGMRRASGLGTSTRSRPLGVIVALDRLFSASSMSASRRMTRS